jgi:hypothetical protein
MLHILAKDRLITCNSMTPWDRASSRPERIRRSGRLGAPSFTRP